MYILRLHPLHPIRPVLPPTASSVLGHVCYAWLASLIGPGKAFVFGVHPFLWGDAMKLVVAACLMPVAWRAVKAMTGTSFSDRGQFQ